MSCSPELLDWMEECYQEEVLYDIPENIKFQYGSLPITHKIGDKYYHGVPPNNYKWNSNNKFTRHVFIYKNKDRPPTHRQWDTHDDRNFCNCHTFSINLNKRRRKTIAYKCNGHNY